MAKLTLVGVALLILNGGTVLAGEDCSWAKALDDLRESVMQETAMQIGEMAIILERMESKLDKLENRLAVSQPQAPAPTNDIFDNRMRGLETSVQGIQKQMDEKLNHTFDRVVSVEKNREKQERVFTDILQKILNTVNTVYERMSSGTVRSSGSPGFISRQPQTPPEITYIQDTLESIAREIKEKVGVFEERVMDQTGEVAMVSRMTLEKVGYVIENMPSTTDLERMGEKKPQIVENDMTKVLEEVRDGFKRCTRAVVNASPITQAISQAAASTNSVSVAPRPQPPPEMSFYLGQKRDDCKMTTSVKTPQNCDQLARGGANCDGPYIVYDAFGKKPMKVVCDMKDGGWTLILRRGPSQGNQPLSFDRSWSSYKHGFGSIQDEFYIGNENMHKLTETPKKLRVELEAFDGDKLVLDYDNFTVAGENDHYRLRIGRYHGNHSRAGQAFRRHNDQIFSTMDRANGHRHCPANHKAGFWWHSCYSVLLTGEYALPSIATAKNGIRWSTWKQDPLKSVVLKIREMPS